MIINNPNIQVGYMDEIFRYAPKVIEFDWKEVPVLAEPDKQDIKNILGNTSHDNYDDKHFGIGTVDRDIERIYNRVEKIKHYPNDKIFGKIFTQDLHIIKRVNEQYYNRLINDYFWLFPYREKYIEGVISMMYALTTMYYHYYDNKDVNIEWNEEKAVLDTSQVKNVILLLYAGISEMFSNSDIKFIPLSSVESLEDNSNQYLNTKKDVVNKDLLPPNIFVSNPLHMKKKPQKLESLVDNYQELYTKIKKMMKVYANKESLINLSEDGERLHLG